MRTGERKDSGTSQGHRVRAMAQSIESFQRIILSPVCRIKPRLVFTKLLVLHEGDPFTHL